MTIKIEIPTIVGSDYTPPIVWRGPKKLGVLSSSPKVKNGKLSAGYLILALRDQEAPGYHGHPETILFTTSPQGKPQLEVHYEKEFAVYELLPDKVVWSDGPPHPDHLQLAVRRVASIGVQEPEIRALAGSEADQVSEQGDDQAV